MLKIIKKILHIIKRFAILTISIFMGLLFLYFIVLWSSEGFNTLIETIKYMIITIFN